MHSTLKMRDSDPHDDFAIAPDVVPAAWADKVLADISRDAKSEAKSRRRQRRPTEPCFGSAAISGIRCARRGGGANGRYDVSRHRHRTISPAPVEPPSTSRWAKSAVMLVLAVGSAAAAAAWQNHGDAAKADDLGLGARIRPHLIAADGKHRARRDRLIRLPLRRPRQSKRLRHLQLRPSRRTSAAPAAAAPSPDTAQLQSMARDLAAMAQQVEQLKASIAELKASQQAAARDVAKTSEVRPSEIKPRRAKSAAKGSAAAAANGRGAAAPAAAGLSARAGRGTGAVAASGSYPSGVDAARAATAAGTRPGPRMTNRSSGRRCRCASPVVLRRRKTRHPPAPADDPNRPAPRGRSTP